MAIPSFLTGLLILVAFCCGTPSKKQVVSLQEQLDKLSSRLSLLESQSSEFIKEKGEAVKVQPRVSSGGAVYTRWGRTVCPAGSSFIYAGYTANSASKVKGGGTNYQCLASFTEHDNITPNGFMGSLMAGVEYETGGFGLLPGALNQNVPCIRCYTETRSAIMMIPGIVSCPQGWTTEYAGYLMTQRGDKNHQATHECVDSNPEFLPNGSANDKGSGFYFIRPNCKQGIPCPLPYNEDEELRCVVCSN